MKGYGGAFNLSESTLPPAVLGQGDAPGRRRQSRRRPTVLRAAVIFTGAFTAFLGAWLLLRPGGMTLTTEVSAAARFVCPLLLVPCCLRGMSRLVRSPEEGWKRLQGWVPVALGGGILMFGAGRAIAGYQEAVLHRSVSTPSPADICFLASYPFLVAGVLLLPNRLLSVATRTRVVLDVLLLLTGIAAFSWYWLVGPAIVDAHASVPSRAISAAYPVADFLAICCLLLLWTVNRETRLRRVAVVLGVALAILGVSDSVREYQLLHGMGGTNTLLDLLRPAGYMLIGVAALVARGPDTRQPAADAAYRSIAPRPSARGIPRVWRYLLPYASVPAVVALMIYVARTPGDASVATGVYGAGALLIELVFLHQYLDYRDLIAFANRNARLESLAAADPITGLPNHRTVVSALDVEFERARRYRHPCAALFLDLDHFKALNDSYGHPAGDAALREFASVVRTGLRGPDILGRWGGEEFVAMLPETDGQAAMAVAERIRAAVAAHTFWAAGGAHVTCSIGVAIYPQDAETRDELISMADRAMYAAKHLGRNQVRMASDPAVEALGAEAGKSGAREEAALLGTVEALAGLIEARDHQTGRHVHDVAALATRLALDLGLDTSDAHRIGLAGRLRDIGKVAVPERVLGKAEQLTEEEWMLVRKHPAVGATIVSRVPALRVLAPIIRAHHEHWDGTGYPDRLAGDEIPLSARIICVADAYQAMTSDRPYHRATTPEQALAEMERCAGAQFDPDIVAALRRVLQFDSIPTGAAGVA